MSRRQPLLLAKSTLHSLLTPSDYFQAAQHAFLALAEGRARTAAPLHIEVSNGVFHAKGGTFAGGANYVALKLNANFPDNQSRYGMPTIQGAILLCDAENGQLLAILDSGEITLRRTAAASALAAHHLAPPRPRTLLICGCGVQAWAHVEALADIFPFEDVLFWDLDPQRALSLAARACVSLPLHGAAVTDLPAAARRADIIVTCTTATTPYLSADMVRRGAFIAAVGADNPAKSELTPDLMAAASIVCDSIDQCAEMGDARHALQCGAIARDHLGLELSAVVAGAIGARNSAEDIVVFDSTGLGVQDAAAAAMAFRRASETQRGASLALTD